MKIPLRIQNYFISGETGTRISTFWYYLTGFLGSFDPLAFSAAEGNAPRPSFWLSWSPLKSATVLAKSPEENDPSPALLPFRKGLFSPARSAAPTALLPRRRGRTSAAILRRGGGRRAPQGWRRRVCPAPADPAGGAPGPRRGQAGGSSGGRGRALPRAGGGSPHPESTGFPGRITL